MPLFDVCPAVERSAAARPKTGKDSIRFAPVGFDFPFVYPAGTAAALKLAGEPWRAMRDLPAKEIGDRPDHRNHRFEAADRPSRGLGHAGGSFRRDPTKRSYSRLRRLGPKKSGYACGRDFAERRLVERRCVSGAQPVRKLSGVGSVGSRTPMGLPAVHALESDSRLAGRCRVRPFETGLKELAARDLEDRPILLAKIYPSLVESGAVRHPIGDARQARAGARHMAERDDAGELARTFDGPPELPPEERRIAQEEEAWIPGVAEKGA